MKTLLSSRMSRRTLGKLLGGSLAALAASTAMPGFALAQSEQVLRIAHPTFDLDWSPLRGGGVYYRWNSLWWAAPMYFDEAGEIQPYVFTSWQSNEDGSVWTFKLDPNAKFSDGSPITSAEVKSSWSLSAMPSTKNQRVDQVLSSVAGYAEVTGGTATELSGVETTDAGTVIVTLSAPDPIFFQKIANHLAPIVPLAARDANGEEMFEWWHPDSGVVVSGPFKPVSMDLDGGVIIFEPNENFFGPKPNLTRVEIRSVEDSVTATALLQAGEFDAHTELATPTMIQDLGPEFSAGPFIPKGQHFWLNVNREPTNDPKVRQALIQAIDRDRLFQATFPEGPHQKADQILNAVTGVDPEYDNYPFDPVAAKQALAESTYGGPDALPRLMIVGISTPANEAAGQYIAEQWRQNLGITAVDMKPQIDNYAGPDQGNVQIFRDDVGTRVPDAVAYLNGSIQSGSSNAVNKLGGYANADVDRLLAEASVLGVDDPNRDGKAREAQALFRNDWAFIPWYYEAMSRWAMPYVGGMEKNLDWQVVRPWAIAINK